MAEIMQPIIHECNLCPAVHTVSVEQQQDDMFATGPRTMPSDWVIIYGCWSVKKLEYKMFICPECVARYVIPTWQDVERYRKLGTKEGQRELQAQEKVGSTQANLVRVLTAENDRLEIIHRGDIKHLKEVLRHNEKLISDEIKVLRQEKPEPSDEKIEAIAIELHECINGENWPGWSEDYAKEVIVSIIKQHLIGESEG